MSEKGCIYNAVVFFGCFSLIGLFHKVNKLEKKIPDMPIYRCEKNTLGDPNIPELFDVRGKDTIYSKIDGRDAWKWKYEFPGDSKGISVYKDSK